MAGPKVQTAFFSGNNAGDSQSNVNGSNLCFNARASGFEFNASNHSQQDGSKFSGQHCYICVNTQNVANTSIPAAKEHMAMLSALLTSYDDLIVGKIGNSMMTKEDYDQVDPEEMELMDVRWALAAAVRRAQRFMDITGRKDLMNPNITLGFEKSKV